MDVTEGIQDEGQVIVRALALDSDRGNYGMMTYSILNDKMKEIFSIDADTGMCTDMDTLFVMVLYLSPISRIQSNPLTLGPSTVLKW